MGKLKNDQHELFCREYLVDKSKKYAAIRAGYSPRSAHNLADRLMRRKDVRKRIDELSAAHLKRLDLSAHDVVRRYASIALANPNELTAIVRGACRYCYGEGHRYQHRTEDEFNTRMESWAMLPESKRAVIQPPSDEGGFGFSPKRDPHPECPMCDGDGAARTRIGDTTKLSPEAAMLFAGVKETQHGIEIKMHDQMAALDSLAKHLGVFEKDNEQKNPANGIHSLIETINKRGSKAPIATQEPGGGEE